MTLLAGIDIGGTKCAVSLGIQDGDQVQIIAKRRFLTLGSPVSTIERLLNDLEELLQEHVTVGPLAAIGISCGGPLNSKAGLILSPPNLPGWSRVDIVRPFRERFRVPVALQNDANACALAEWQWGAGRGSRNMIFLTFGTGMGAGLILDGRLYSGASDMAGEVGHIRLEPAGPMGYGKLGSFEGFCSGGGIAELGKMMAEKMFDEGKAPSFCHTPDDIDAISAEAIGEAAQRGEIDALLIFQEVAYNLGRGLAILIDILNPDCIVIGSIYGKQQAIIEPILWEELHCEALPHSLAVCKVLPSGLKDNVGDYAGLSVAMHQLI
ncbi:ROK family protein [Paenibacillus radicis (ex Xue et al. 2023)]|uniref:ROK family protein n=1 Tax=Paenibacillus radicis (ex Xue et al. 2023) TaxID=2972489 RepID=A0ABT1YLR7_9BACL|nr:ROK family protein [Paenibacillus radicis (ex Xue et al. 2023)]MCR8634132.1 ROK family protein [Paenibacillus radicis (ex Xue et al. 2023)]